MGVDVLSGLFDDIPTRQWGNGANVWDAYTPEARERLVSWGRPLFEPLMQSSELEAEAMKRLHVYAHLIALLYAWSESKEKVELAHVNAAIAVINVSRDFLRRLMRQDGEAEIPKFKQYEMSLEHKVIEKVRREPGIMLKKIMQDLRRQGSCQDISNIVRRLRAAGVLEHRKQQRKKLWVA